MSTLDKKVWRSLASLKAQSITIALVVASGISVYIASASAYESLLSARDKFYERSFFSEGFITVKNAPDILEEKILEIPGIQDVRLRIVKESVVDFPDETLPSAGKFVSITEGMNELVYSRGRSPLTKDEVVLSEEFAKANHLGIGNKIGVVLQGEKKFLNIVGIALSAEYVYVFRPASPLPDPKHYGILWMKKEALEESFQMQGAFNDIIFRFTRNSNHKNTLKTLDLVMENYGGLDSYDRDKLPSHSFLRDEFKQLKTTAFAMPFIFLGVAAFLLHMVSNRIISKEREQIATLKALGYSNISISMHYAKLLLIISSMGSILGIFGGIYFGKQMLSLYGEYYKFPDLILVLRPTLLMEGFSVGILAGLVGAIFSVLRVLHLNPAEAMRPPHPESYTKNRLEKLILNLPTKGKMILRNLFQKPFRTVLASLGISSSVMIMVIGTFMFGAVDNMMTMQFNILQRESIMINFFSPVSYSAVYEINKEPSVLHSEGLRMVPIRIRKGIKSKEILLQGISQNAELRRLVGKGEIVIEPPTSGILLNSQVAEKLGLNVRDVLQIEVLEGNRKKLKVQIVGIVEEILGQGAYMDIHSVNKLLGEDHSINSLAIRTDPNLEAELLLKLKKMPKISSINTRDRTLKVFKELTARSIMATTVILLFFACIIAIGVVYNTAMITLSERSFELGSLRILGFTKEEVFSILALELVFEIIIALPIGCITGYYCAYWMFHSVETEGFNVPLSINLSSYGIALLTTIFTAIVSFFILYFKIKSMDLISILKIRE